MFTKRSNRKNINNANKAEKKIENLREIKYIYSVEISGFIYHLDFSLKSTLVKLQGLKLPYFAILGALKFVNLVSFQPSESAKIHKNDNSEPLKVFQFKWQILHF